MTNAEIQELIEAYGKLAAKVDIYSTGIIRAATRKVEELRSQLAPEVPKAPEKTGIDKWFKTK